MSQTGLVAFFDILGYQDIINNNLIDDVAKIISEIILGLPEDAKKKMMELFPESKRLAGDISSKINTRIISDSIILACDVPSDSSESIIGAHWCIFLAYASTLCFKSFDKGLPLRGAVDYGEFFLTDQCFAGRPLVNCFRLGNNLEFAGCVLTANAEEQMSKFPENITDALKSFLNEYLVPAKDDEKRMFIIDWFFHLEKSQRKDVRQYIVNQFKAHNKDISEKVIRKLNNTEIMVRCLIKD